MNENYITLKNWHDAFDICQFFDKDNSLAKTTRNSAFGLITSNQVVNVLSNGTGNGNHYDTSSIISLAIQGIDFSLTDTKYNNEHRREIIKGLANNINFTMRNEIDDSICIIFIPERISLGQYNLLSWYLEKIANELQEILTSSPLFYYDDEMPRTNDINIILDYAKKRIDFNKKDKEDKNIIGYTLDENTIKR